jgi:hypothetical protein
MLARGRVISSPTCYVQAPICFLIILLHMVLAYPVTACVYVLQRLRCWHVGVLCGNPSCCSMRRWLRKPCRRMSGMAGASSPHRSTQRGGRSGQQQTGGLGGGVGWVLALGQGWVGSMMLQKPSVVRLAHGSAQRNSKLRMALRCQSALVMAFMFVSKRPTSHQHNTHQDTKTPTHQHTNTHLRLLWHCCIAGDPSCCVWTHQAA